MKKFSFSKFTVLVTPSQVFFDSILNPHAPPCTDLSHPRPSIKF